MFHATGHFFAQEIVYFARCRHSTVRVLGGGVFFVTTSGVRAFNIRLNAASIFVAAEPVPALTQLVGDVVAEHGVAADLRVTRRPVSRDAARVFSEQHLSIPDAESLNLLAIDLQQPRQDRLTDVRILFLKEATQTELVLVFHEDIQDGLPRLRVQMLGRRLLEAVQMLDLLLISRAPA